MSDNATHARYDSVFRDDLFKGQVIIVTGGGSGIGRCIAHELTALGAHAILVGRKREKLDAVAEEIAGDGGSCETASFDIRDEDAVFLRQSGGPVCRGGRPVHEYARQWPSMPPLL